MGPVVVAEWLRRWTRNPLGSPRAGSNPADYAGFLIQRRGGYDFFTRPWQAFSLPLCIGQAHRRPCLQLLASGSLWSYSG